MNRIFAWVLLNCSIATNCAVVHAARSHEDVLPENTWLTVSVADLSELTEVYLKGPLPALFDRKEIHPFMEKLKESSIGKQFSGLTVTGELLTWQVFIEKFPGRITFAVGGEDFSFEKGVGSDYSLIADYAGDVEFLVELSEKLYARSNEAKLNIVEEDYFGTTLYLEETVYEDEVSVHSAWTVVDGLFLEAASTAELKTLVDSVVDGGHRKPLSANPVYLDAQAEMIDCEACVFINLAAVIPAIEALINQESIQLPPNALGITTNGILNSLKLQNLQSLYLGLKHDRAGLRIHYGLVHQGLEGLLSLLSFTSGDYSEVFFVPAQSINASITHFSIPEAISNLEAIIAAVSPAFSNFLQMQIDALSTNAQVDIRENIIENFGDQIVACSFFDSAFNPAVADSESTLNHCYIYTLRNPQSFAASLEVIKTLFSAGNELFDSKEYLNTPIYVLKGNSDHNNFSYALKDRYLLFALGDPHALEPIILALEKPGDHLLESAMLQDALAELPANPNQIQYADIGKLWKNIAAQFFAVIESGHSDYAKNGDDFKTSNVPYFMVAGTYVENNRIAFEALIQAKPDEDN